MTAARKARLKQARAWYAEQNFTEESHVVKAYRKRFNVDKDCAMKELCMLGVLSPEKQRSYESQLAAKARKRAERKAAKASVDTNPYQDENFFFIVGYTPGGAPYGVTWDEARRDGFVEEEE